LEFFIGGVEERTTADGLDLLLLPFFQNFGWFRNGEDMSLHDCYVKFYVFDCVNCHI
jgi:hypothetical protein